MNAKDIYRLFSKAYYRKGYRRYLDDECSVTQTTTCMLKAFNMRKIPREFADRKKVILMWHTLLHRTVQRELEEEGFKIEHEQKIRFRNVTLYSHVDAVDDIETLELKGITRLPYEPLSHHRLQANTYAFMEDREQNYIAYIHKPSGIVKVFPIFRNVKMFEYTKLRALRLCTHIQRNVQPQPEPSWECQYCEYTDMCPAQHKTFARQVLP